MHFERCTERDLLLLVRAVYKGATELQRGEGKAFKRLEARGFLRLRSRTKKRVESTPFGEETVARMIGALRTAPWQSVIHGGCLCGSDVHIKRSAGGQRLEAATWWAYERDSASCPTCGRKYTISYEGLLPVVEEGL